MSRSKRIFISAGEASGDRLGAGLARALRLRRPDIELLGMGGPLMREEGVQLIQDSAEVAVMGIFEVLSHLPTIWRVMKRLETSLKEQPPDLLVPVDFPDFNLRLAARARRLDLPVVYFVSPQVWAWRSGRVKTIRKLVRRVLVLFPFEEKFYENSGVPVTFVGHPLLDGIDEPRDPARMRELAGLSRDRPVVALMPGSRQGELSRLLEPILQAAVRIRERHPEVLFLLPLASGMAAAPVVERLRALDLGDTRIHRNDFPRILAACEAGVVASGTASLEAAIEGLPIVVVYRVNRLTYLLGRALVKLENFSLPNLVAGQRLVPELIQGDCEPERIATELLSYLDDPDYARKTREALLTLRYSLGGPGAFDRAAEAVLDELESSGAK